MAWLRRVAGAFVSVSRVALAETSLAVKEPSQGCPRPSAQTRHAPVCVINGRFHGQRITGVQRYAHEIVRALDPLLVAQGRRAEIAMPRGTEVPKPAAALALQPPSRLSGHLWEQIRLPSERHAPLLNLCNTGPILHRRQVVCLHDANVFLQPGSYRRAFRLFYRTLHPLLARRAAVVTTVSGFSADMLARHLGIERRRIVVLPNGHEHALRWDVDTGALQRLPGMRPFVLLLGSRASHKNIGLLLRLAPALDAEGLDLVVTGGRDAIFADAAPAVGVAANLHWLGPVSDAELAGLMGQALCLAFPSWTEGFGLPIVEAMARGCPVVASDRASMPEVCGSAALLAAPDAPGEWLHAIRSLTQSPSLRADLIGRGTEQVQRFSWSRSAAGYLALLETLA